MVGHGTEAHPMSPTRGDHQGAAGEARTPRIPVDLPHTHAYEVCVGHVFVDATIRGRRAARVRFLVDSGATYNLIPAELAQRLGIEPGPIRDRVRLATGRRVRLPTALGAVRIDGREAATIFWIGPCEEPLLGVETLEALGLSIDPKRGRLRPTRPYATRLGGFERR